MIHQFASIFTNMSESDLLVLIIWGCTVLGYSIHRQHPRWFKQAGILAFFATLFALAYFVGVHMG